MSDLIYYPKIVPINSGNVFGFSIDHLKHLFIDEYLEKRIIFERCLFGINLIEEDINKLKYYFKSSLHQAIEYLNNAIKVDLAISPVLLYYSLINFLKCYYILKDNNILFDKRNKKHGIVTVDLDKKDIFCSKIRICKNGNIIPYLKINNLHLKNDSYTILDSLKSLNFLSTVLSRHNIRSNILKIYDDTNDGLFFTPLGIKPSRVSFDMAHFSSLTNMEQNLNNVIKIQDYFLPVFKDYSRKLHISITEHYHDRSALGMMMGCVDFCPQGEMQKNTIDFLSTHRDHNSNKFLIFENNTNINDQVFHIYTSLCFLGFISRYHSDIWKNFLDKQSNTIILERYINGTAIYLLYKFLTILSNEYLVFK